MPSSASVSPGSWRTGSWSSERSPLDRPRLAVLRALGLGDFLTGIPAFRALRSAHPDHHLVLAAPAWLEPLVRLGGFADEVADTRGLEPIDARIHGPDIAVNLHGRGPQSHRLLLDLAPGRMYGFANPDVPDTGGAPRWRSGEHEVRRWCRMLSAFGLRADPASLDLPAPALRPPDHVVGATVIHPGAAGAARRWPVERWGAVAAAEVRAGRRVVVTGTGDEVEIAEDVARIARLSRESVLAGRTGLLELCAVVAAAGRVACGDTGVGHLATALGTPSVVLFGPTPPAEWGPPPDRPWHLALWKGRRGDPHGDEADPGLLDITADDVVEALGTLPSATPSFPPSRRGVDPRIRTRRHRGG